MRFFRRRRPLHERLAEAGGLTAAASRVSPPAAQPPGWHGEQGGEPGIHGVPRARRWDAVSTASASDARGDAIRFVALPDGTLLLDDDPDVDEEQPDGALAPLAEAVEATLVPPYRAEAVRRGRDAWAVAARRITLLEAPGLAGEEAELVASASGRTLHVDGEPHFGSVPAFEAAGRALAGEYVVRARRLEGDLWEVEAAAL